MKALTFHDKGNIAFEQVADPQLLADDEVIVQTKLTAICGSDLHVYHAREKGLDHGTVMGHEFVGEIVEAGRSVKRFRRGNAVICSFFNCCGNCFYCQNGLTCRCEKGSLFGWVQGGRGLQGAQAEYVRVPMADSTLTAIPEGLSPEEALLLCDILPTGFFCADMATDMTTSQAGRSYAVIGCGPVGLLSILGLRELGAEHIYAIDLVPERQRMAENFGAVSLSGSPDELAGQLAAVTGGRGPDAVLELVGSPAAQALAYRLVRPGGILAVAGVHTNPHFAFTPEALYNKNLTYKTGRCPVHRYIPRLTELLQSGKYRPADIITHRMDISQGPRGYQIFDRKAEGCLKVVLSV